MNENIELAIEQFRNNAGRYRRSSRYYAGEHSLSFATEKFANTFGDLFREFALNLCPAVCDAIKDKLKITGFGVERVSELPPQRQRNAATFQLAGGEPVSYAIDKIWRANRMAIRAGEVHKEALKNGDAYVIVWPAADGTVQIFPNSAETCTVCYDEEMPGRVKWAAKYWRTPEKRTRLNLFFPDRIEKYISKDAQDGFLPNAESFIPTVESARSIASKNAEERDGSRTLNNPFGVVPVFHFANNADIGSFGVSELEPAIPVQDGLNKAVLDMLVAMEVCAYRQRWAAGIEIQYDKDGNAAAPFKAGIDHLWLAENPDAKFGDFAAADLEQFLKVKDGFRIDIASVTGTPLYYLMPQVRGFPSGESLRKAETRFVAKVRDRQEQFGTVWEDVMSFALKIAGRANAAISTEWEPASPLTEREMLENLKIRRELGLYAEEGLNKI